MNPDLTHLVCVTTANLMQQTVEDFCKQICELDTSGGFTSFLFKPKQEVMFSAPQQCLLCLCVPKGPKGAALSIIRARLGEVLKVCYYCGKAGHCARECRLKWAHDITRIPPQINHTQAPLFNCGYADQYQVS